MTIPSGPPLHPGFIQNAIHVSGLLFRCGCCDLVRILGAVDDGSEMANNPKNVIATKIEGRPWKKAAARNKLHKPGGIAVPHHFEPDAHGAIALGADSVGCFLFHADAFRGMVNDDGQIFIFKMFVEKVAQLSLRPNEVDPHGQRTAGEDRPANLRLRSFVGAYGVKRNVDEHRGSAYLAASLTSITARPL